MEMRHGVKEKTSERQACAFLLGGKAPFSHTTAGATLTLHGLIIMYVICIMMYKSQFCNENKSRGGSPFLKHHLAGQQ